VQFLTSNEVVASAMGKRRLFDLVNEAVRLSGAGVDFKLSMDEGEDPAMGGDQLKEVLAQLGEMAGRLDKIDGGAQAPGAMQPELMDLMGSAPSAPGAMPQSMTNAAASSNAAVLALGSDPTV
jgi:hypothetical protein